jgi:hypothetical protein
MHLILTALGLYALAVAALYLLRWLNDDLHKIARWTRWNRWAVYADPTYARSRFLLRSEPVVAQRGAISNYWTVEAVKDLKAMWRMDAENEILCQGLKMIKREEARAVACQLVVWLVVAEVFHDWPLALAHPKPMTEEAP